MANTDSPRGFEFVSNMTTGNMPPIRYYPVAAGATTDLYVGQLVAFTSGLLVDAAAFGNSQIVGVCNEYHSASDAANTEIPVISAYGSIFKIQNGSASPAVTGIALATAGTEALLQAVISNATTMFQIGSPTTGSTTTGRSTSSLSGTPTNGNLIVHGWDRRPDNDLTAAYADFYVRIDLDALLTGPEVS
jgi:hypothetical protein